MDRERLHAAVERAIGRRSLVWFGTRGEDVESVADLAQFAAAFSLIGRYGRRSYVHAVALEDLLGDRFDLDTYDLDSHLRSEPVAELRGLLMRELSRPSVLFTYRPTTFLSAVGFATTASCSYLGMFAGVQSAFEHKPWVETSVTDLGVTGIPWTYIADVDQLRTLDLLARGPVVLRCSRSSGGVGLTLLDSPDRLEELWPSEDEAYVSVAPYVEGGIPVNVAGVVWHDGVTVHPASVQLIGVRECINRRFGYCGNDFGAAADLGEQVLDRIQSSTTAIGSWLGRSGYLGAFGVDYLVSDGLPLFTEVNPRFQGSTHASGQISVEQQESCVLLEHLAALLGMDAPAPRRLGDLVPPGPGFAHVVVHHTGTEVTRVDPTPLVRAASGVPGFCRADVLTSPELSTRPGGTVARLTVRGRVTDSGFSLREPWQTLLRDWARGETAATAPAERLVGVGAATIPSTTSEGARR